MQLKVIIDYIVNQGLSTIDRNCKDEKVILDYVSIFSRNNDEYNKFLLKAQVLGREVDRQTAKTGHTFVLKKLIMTQAGPLKLLKIRKSDPTRPQRGAPDFKVSNYYRFKSKYLKTSGNFTLMVRKDYEMIEIKGIDVLVYIPEKPLTDRLKSKNY